jgi:HK97 family phage portal protein
MFHLRGLGNEVEGWSVLEMARRSLGISLASEGMAESAMRNNPRLNLVFKHPKSLSDDAYRRLKDDLDERTQPSAAHKPLLLEDGVDFEALRLNPNDLQLLESRKFQAEEICRWFGLPPHMVALLDRATFSNIESQGREALTNCIMPWVLRFEQEADEKLFRRSHKAMGAYSKMNTNALLRSDAAGRAQLYKALHAVGAISPDEIAELEDLPKIGAERGGNLRVIPMNMQTLEAAMAAAKSTAKRK